DAATARRVQALGNVVKRAKQATVLGSAPDGWNAAHIDSQNADAGHPQHRLILALIGDDACIALTGFLNEDSRFAGAWTTHRETVDQWAASARDYGSAGSPAPAGPTSLPYSMMAAHASTLAMRSRDAAKEKHDLVSVLEILKAISSKRRTHDILFVFVE